ncbi:MAG: FkbM family methyltransferase, partial [Bacteroidetes bacterium]|nr:FkbM family methyltransferase [Bacteroidota bacterium]
MNTLKKILIWSIPHGLYKYYKGTTNFQKDIDNILKMPRYTNGIINLPSHKAFEFVDNMSFYAQYIDFFHNEIYYFRISENKNPLIIDAGANIGLAIVYWKSIYPNAKIIGFEPDSDVFKVLKKNVSRYQDVEIHNYGLYHSETSLPFMSEGADSGSLIFGNDSTRTPNKVIDVKKLSPFLENKVALLKIDIEGAEYEVLKESSSMLKNVEKIFVEYHSFIGQEQVLPELL